jgi:hypothetical protein
MRQEQTKQGTGNIIPRSSRNLTLPREEFALHGMNDTVTLTHRNVCKDGFTIIDEADAGSSVPALVIGHLLTPYRHPSLSGSARALGCSGSCQEGTSCE